MTRIETRQSLIQVGTDVIGSHGFNPTGLNTVLKTAGVPKGSFYYYFASKEEFGLAIIDEFAVAYNDKIAHFLNNEALSPLQRIRAYLDDGLATIREGMCKRGYLIGTLGQELSSQNETFRVRLDQVFEGWKQQFGLCLKSAIDCGELSEEADVEQLSEFLLSGWQGAILRAKMHSSITPLQAFIDIVFTNVLINR
ncbi:TetR/AcrR family transcriptional regulator [Methylophaga sp. UBA2689]|uniref:TetR/AcrR family transcriptional regulator n=1 Tax=Methylophaga sp. UBA2689 TaxID=1946878 RepID=UPI0025CD0A3F|nr:TetR/AcrR family transcriptional regulator [Methylophaga sp. UBA2689]|tara:strand:- start:943 stop:1530 length:588 start_codon:yes stop_codon:yes gene_type:complete